MIPRWVERYIGIPFADEGLTFSGCHCWGLVRLVLATERGLSLPTYDGISWRDLHAVAGTVDGDSRRDPWHPVIAGPVAFDVVIMRGRPPHVGIMVDGQHILHVEERTASVCVPVSHSSIRCRVTSIIRHKVLHDQAALA